MISLLYFASYLLAAFGLAFVVGQSRISLPFRIAIAPDGQPKTVGGSLRGLLVDLLECPGCLGVWIGVSAWAYGLTLGLPLKHWELLAALPLLTCASNFILASITGVHAHAPRLK